jgi:hypothetical protein
MDFEPILEELIQYQSQRLLKIAREIIPTATTDDLLQPNDYPQLENHPHFRYEEGILSGLLSAQTALRAERGLRGPLSKSG